MSITEETEKINPPISFDIVPETHNSTLAKIYYWVKPFYTIILLIVIGSIFFGLGRLSTIEKNKTGIKIEYPNVSETSSAIIAIASTTREREITKEKPNTVVVQALAQSSEVIGSKSGKKYYFPWCGIVKRIKPENQVHFVSIEEARKAGFIPGGNCKGLK